MALATCCALGLGWSWNVPGPVGPAASAQPDAQDATSRDARALALRILQHEDGDQLADGLHPDRLEHQIESALRLIRDRYPAMAEITVRPPVAGILLEIEGCLRDGIGEGWTDLGTGAVFPTGNAEFDDLNARLGLQSAKFWPALDTILLHFAELANPRAAMAAYLAIDGVAYAELDRLLADGSDIALSIRDGLWHVVMRKAWGDCPAGCIHEERHFFTVRNGHVDRLDEETALAMPEFRFLNALAGSGW